MKSIITLVMLFGVMTKVETIHYSNGIVVERIYDKVTDVVPSDIRWVKPATISKIAKSDVIIHRHTEALLANYWLAPKEA